MAQKHDDEDYPTTGHQWDGIREYDKPMPRWWLWTFYATIIWGIGYTILYPAWPGINGATPGLLGFSTRGEVAKDIQEVEAANAGVNEELASADFSALLEDETLVSYATQAGAGVFRTWCSQCHGAGAAGVQAAGYPNLLDDDWLWGGTLEDIAYTIRHGIRNETDLDARWSQMTAFDEILPDEEIDAVVQYVLAISGQDHDAGLAEQGAEVFDLNCASCHGADGMGDPFQGAPNLTDAIWLYGGSAEKIEETVRYSRFGVMPAWGDRLSEAEVRAVAVYVHSLGGGQ